MNRRAAYRSRGAQPGFPAAHSGYCNRCGNVVRIGDRVVTRRDGVMHVGCASGQDDA